MKTQYHPVNTLTNAKGPAFDSMTLAALWVVNRSDTWEWTVRHFAEGSQ